MNCLRCATPSRPGQRFCESCGGALERGCPQCGARCPPDAKFCGQCGHRVDAALPVDSATTDVDAEVRADPEGERRQLTVLFADVVGSTSLSQRVDPEVLRDVLRRYQIICGECIARFGGGIKQYLGDGILAYFGHPIAHENDAERAVHAGLALVEGVRRMARGPDHEGVDAIQVRVGIHTGLVVVGSMGPDGHPGTLAVGETPNLAARVQGESAPDAVTISRATLDLVGDRFETVTLGLRTLKGIAAPTELYTVTGIATRSSAPRFAGSVLVGRERERRHLAERWAQARSGSGQCVFVSGDAGIGKSRLLDDLRDRVIADGGRWLAVSCSPFFQNSALHPMVELLESEIAAAVDAGPDRATRLRSLLADAGIVDASAPALVAALLDIDDPGRAALERLAPAQRKRRTVDALIAWLVAPSRDRPLVLLVEDLHWMDASTRELLGLLMDRVVALPVLVLPSFRPEFVPPWPMQAHWSTIALARLSSDETIAVIRAVASGDALPASVVTEIVRRADGVPLFVEEMTKAILASGRVAPDGGSTAAGGRGPQFDVPFTLRDSLTARLDRLGDAKAIAQIAAVLGREFEYDVLHAICDLPEEELEERLAILGRADIVQPTSVSSRMRYAFKHALIQEAAYDTLLLRTRQQQHARIAATYVERFADVAQSRPALVAYHYVGARNGAASVPFWQLAGEQAMARSGLPEAIAHFQEALGHVPLLPLVQRTTAELKLRLQLGPALSAVAGFAAPATGENCARACALTETDGTASERFAALWADWLYKNTKGDLDAASGRCEALVTLSHTLPDDGYALQAHHARWTNAMFMGDVAGARADAMEGIRLFDPARHWDHKFRYGGHDPGVCARNFGAFAAWSSGHSAEALRLADSALALARGMDHSFSLATSYFWIPIVLHCAGDSARAGTLGDALMALCDQHGFKQWRGIGMVVSGAAATLRGQADGAMSIDEGLRAHATQRGPVGVTAVLHGIAAEGHVAVGNEDRALACLADAIALSDATGMALHRCEILRMRTGIRLRRGEISRADALDLLARASADARRQGALALAWRSDLMAADLHLQDGNAAHTRRILAVILGSESDGCDGSDLERVRQRMSALG